MPQSAQGQTWSEVLCCPLCSQVFSEVRQPVSCPCGHVLCRTCVRSLQETAICPLDQIDCGFALRDLPTNTALLSILGYSKSFVEETETLLEEANLESPDRDVLERCEKHLISMGNFLRQTESERGASVWSEILSRTVQRKLVSLLCIPIFHEESRCKALKTMRTVAERVLSELLLSQQSGSNVSTQLWTAVRARGCQFLGPAMQEDVLKLILLTLGKGALIARKTLVMYVVQTLVEDYPQVSKTCVGHVVQLLYRASCFNVMKRDGESSLMQLKEEFRTYENLRREHDAQIVGMAIETGLRISPDQWSALLYGDQQHRSHMQSIIDKLQSPQSFAQGIDELRASACKIPRPGLVAAVRQIQKFCDAPSNPQELSWEDLASYLSSMDDLLSTHADFVAKRNERRHNETASRKLNGPSSRADMPIARVMSQATRGFKTRMCKETAMGRLCPRGATCTFAHSRSELRPIHCTGMPMPPKTSFQGAPLSQVLVGPFTNPPPPPPGAHQMPPQMQAPPPPPPQAVLVDHKGNTIVNEMGVPMVPVMPVHPHGPIQVLQELPPTNQQVHNHHDTIYHVFGQMPPGQLPPPPGAPGNMGAPQQVLVQVARPPPNAQLVMAPGLMWNPGAPPPHPTQGPPPPGQIIMQPMQQPVTWIPTGHPPGAPVYEVPTAMPDGTLFWTQGGCVTAPLPPQPMPPLQEPNMNTAPASARVGDGEKGGEAPAPADPDHVDVEQLEIRKAEIMNRLAMSMEEDDGEDSMGHVSYTVASSVLDDRYPVRTEALVARSIELPPIPSTYSVRNSHNEDAMWALGDIATQSHAPIPMRSRTKSIDGAAVATTVRTMCTGTGANVSEASRTATVQSVCSTMTVQHAIRQPLSTPAIQKHVLVREDLKPTSVNLDRLPRVICPLNTPQDAQNFVAQALDKIVDVKERLTETSTAQSSVEAEQLRVELLIASRQMSVLDPATQYSCLMRELEQVERQLEQTRIGTHMAG